MAFESYYTHFIHKKAVDGDVFNDIDRNSSRFSTRESASLTSELIKYLVCTCIFPELEKIIHVGILDNE
jgi:hypothetical protein